MDTQIHRGRDESDVATSQGMPGATEAARGKEGPSPKLSEGTGPLLTPCCHLADTLLSEFWPPEVREDKFLLHTLRKHFGAGMRLDHFQLWLAEF